MLNTCMHVLRSASGQHACGHQLEKKILAAAKIEDFVKIGADFVGSLAEIVYNFACIRSSKISMNLESYLCFLI